ncbi:MAG: response regulator, partial [Desulfobacteraceae bacterium]|nr:response regulator [Desulfobacteraceae bacterium]
MERRKPKVLIVDDEKEISSALGRIFKKNKIEFVSCESGEAGIKELAETEFPFSLIISDQRMPGMTGAEFLEQAKEMSPATVRFLISGYSDSDVLINAINKGVVQKFIQKPWKMSSLVDAVKKSFMQYKNSFGNEKLVRLARDRNRKMYQLNHTLNKKIAGHKKTIEEFDRKIAEVKIEIGKIAREVDTEEPLTVEYFEKLFKQ